ncbi:gliding motility lipoprotein GldH [Mucilaginibacter sp. HMF5004]|uniref:gliding motility lipoprotein GldH n=1 Tax=Mucilaginibacter rivuli TaxID=2857527 RepID=UPI001C5DA8A0|nr:gliding motility lipoprotein GldH [Mucilaginibacter rivuli]MBW4890406.1 gliding motility lipoprotein GldH [Mucilaginibacter rivuli]
MRVSKIYMVLIATTLTLLLNACMNADKNTIIDHNVEVTDLNWSYVDKVKIDVKIDDPSVFYNVYLNLRITPDYKYSNLFVLIHQIGPDRQVKNIRQEYTLANPDGEWLGQGSGNLYNYQMPSRLHYKFPAKGIYHFVIEQNMRDNPLREVSDVGLRVEKAE